MIRHTHVSHLFEKATPKKEETKKIEEYVNVKKAHHKANKTIVPIKESIILDEPIMENDTIDDVENLSKWLEEDTEE